MKLALVGACRSVPNKTQTSQHTRRPIMLCACAPCAAAAAYVAAAAPQAGIGCVGASRMLAGDSSSVDAAAALSAAAAADPFSAASSQTGSSRAGSVLGPAAPQALSLMERLWGEGGVGGDAKTALLGMGLILLSQVCVALFGVGAKDGLVPTVDWQAASSNQATVKATCIDCLHLTSRPPSLRCLPHTLLISHARCHTGYPGRAGDC